MRKPFKSFIEEVNQELKDDADIGLELRERKRRINLWIFRISVALQVLIVTSVLTGLYLFQSLGCGARWSGTYETEWGMLTGCRVKINERWYPETVVRMRSKP